LRKIATHLVRKTDNPNVKDSSFPRARFFGISRSDKNVFACPPTEQGSKMEKSETSAEANGLPVLITHWRTPATMPVPDDFSPLRLILQPGGAIVELTQADMLFGRHSLADVRLPLPDVSRRHCRFLFGQGVWQVIDLNSLNGVFLNGQPIRQATLQQGDLIRIGGFTFAVDMNTAGVVVPAADAAEGLRRCIFKTLPAAHQIEQPRRLSA
jgi:hypothetical protein